MCIQAGVQGLFQRSCSCKTVTLFPQVIILHLELSPVSQPTYSWSSASYVPQEHSGGFGGAQEDLRYYGPGANGRMCPIFLGSEESKGAHKNKYI